MAGNPSRVGARCVFTRFLIQDDLTRSVTHVPVECRVLFVSRQAPLVAQRTVESECGLSVSGRSLSASRGEWGMRDVPPP